MRVVAVSALVSLHTSVSAQDEVGDTAVINIVNTVKGVKLSGIISDAATGKGISGIRIQVEGYSAAITDNNGRYTLSVPDYNTHVKLGGDGYETRVVALKGRSTLNQSISDHTISSLHQPINTPFNTISKRDLTSASSQLDVVGWNQPFEVSDALLQGQIPGLNVIRRSGTPGVGANMFLRGYNSLYGTNKPLVIIDDVIFDVNDYGESIIANNYTNPLALVDIKDIDHITVLKDASSTYGMKGANGAIIITTARAKEQATRIDFGAFTSFNNRPARLPVMEAGDYRTYLSEMLFSKGMSSSQIAALTYMNDDPANPNYARTHYNTDWQDKVLDNTIGQNYYLKVTGGDNIATYGLSVGFMQNKGVINTTDLNRYNTRFNAEFNFSRRFTGQANLAFSFNEQNLKDQGIAEKTAPLYLSLIKSPFLPDREVNDQGIVSPNLADSDSLGISNPSVLINDMIGQNKYYRFAGSFKFNFEISKYLNASTLIGIVYDKVRENVFVPRKGVANDTLSNAVADSRLGTQVKRLFSLYNDTRLEYVREFNRKHSLAARLGLRYQQNDAEQDFALSFNSATDELVTVQNGLNALRQVGGGIGEWNWMNAYFGADYGLNKKLFLSFNMAMDGSSRVGSKATSGIGINGIRFSLNPSLAGAWLVSSENFMKGSGINLLKLRASYSITGNDDIGNYSGRQTYIAQNFLGVQGLVRKGIANPAIQWESNRKLNGGIDLAFLNERVNIGVDVYQNTTNNMLVYERLGTVIGFESVLTNGGRMQNTGLDFSVNARIINTAAWKWDIGLNAGTYKNKLLKVPAGQFMTEYAGATILSKEGEAANQFYGYVSNGVIATSAEATSLGLMKKGFDGSLNMFAAGDIKFADLNGDKIIDEKDRQVIGNPNPDLFGGITNRVAFKRFELTTLFTFSQGNDVFNYVRYRLESASGIENQLLSVNNRWRVEGQVTESPKATWGDPMGNARFSNRWIEDGSYFRLRSATLQYSFPMKDKFLKNLNVYLAGNNLFTLSKYKGFDPEFSASPSVFAQGVDTGLDPLFRSVTLGLRIGL